MSATWVGGQSGFGNGIGPLIWAAQAKPEKPVNLPKVTGELEKQ